MSTTYHIFKREVSSFFATPVGYVFICVFLVLNGVFTYVLGNFYERNQADLAPFFSFQPWLFLFLVPAISMRTWAEERKNGTIELLMALPVSHFSCVLAKFLAAWSIIGLALCMTFSLWLSLEYLGQPDRGIIIAGYIGAWLMSAAFLALSMCMSALTKNQVIAFVLSVMLCFLFVASGSSIVLDLIAHLVNADVLDVIASFSFLVRFEAISKGILSLGDSLYFISFAFVFLIISSLIIEHNKGQ